MSTHSKVDLSTLGWVKTEIDETLKQARLALEAFAENPSDKTRLRFCITHLHQVVGTLLMVELDGAAMLAREAEALADDIINDKVTPDSRVLDALTRGILTLPDYLARLQAGQSDVPLKHIGLMNEMRAVRNTTPISELELFSPDLSVRPPPAEGHAEKLAEAEYRDLAKQLRSGFQPALLEWLRDASNKAPLEKIADIFVQLQSKSGISVLEQLFWVSGGYIEAMREDGLEVTAERKKLFGRLDQHIKKIIDGADRSTIRIASEDLTRALLWEIAQAKSPGARVTQLKRAFDLEFLLSGDTAEASAAASDLPTPEALASVSSALGKEIEAAQDLMSTYFDPESRGTTSLEPLLESFHKMSGTLDMLNVPMLRALVDELSLTCRAVIDNKIANPEVISMPMAEALLMVESSTRDISRSPAEWKKQIEEAIRHLHGLHSPEEADAMPATDGLEVSDGELTESDYKQLLSVVAGEVGVNLGRIEEALEGFAADASRVEALDEVPQLLSQILGAMQILGQARAAELVEATKGHVEDIRRGALVADSAIMDGLAVSVGSIGAYVEGLRAERQNLDTLIDSAFTEMEAALASGHGKSRDPAMLIDGVRLSLESWLDDRENEVALETLTQQLEELTRLAQEQGQEKITRISAEMNHLLTLVAGDPSRVSDEIVETLKQSFTAMSALAGRRMTLRTSAPTAPEPELEPESKNVPPPAAAPTAPPPRPVVDADFDAEIMDIFIEDAREVLENIRNKFVVWREDTDNQNALTELRRGYHTLKGSGRMVGASEVAELAWDVENVLNRIREGKITPSAAIIELLQQTQDALPSLIDVLAGGPPHGIDVESLRENARALAQGSAPVAPKAPTAGVSQAEAAPVEDADLPKLERTLLDIFTTEAIGNLDNIRQQVAHCREAGGACFVTESFFRSAHTLQGNARSLGIQVMSESCAEIEKLLHALKSENVPLNDTWLDLVSRFEGCVRRLVDLLNSGATSSGKLRGEFADLARDLHAENQRIVVAERAGHGTVAPSPQTEEIEAEAAPLQPQTDETPSASAPPPARPAAVAKPPPPVARATEPSEVEQIDPELLEIFQEEATDILTAIEEALTRWRSQPGSRTQVADLKRSLHTLKGGARMAGAMAMGNLSHNTETLLKNIEDNKVAASNEVFDLLDEAHDMLVMMLDGAREGKPVRDTSLLNAKLAALASGQPLPDEEAAPAMAPVAKIPESAPIEEPVPEAMAPVSGEIAQDVEAAAPAHVIDEIDERRDLPETEDKQWPEKMERRGQVRVNTSLLNELVNYAGEVSLSRSRMEQQIYSFRDNLGELSRNIVRFRDQIRELEIQSESQILYRMEHEGAGEGGNPDFDPLEFDRFSRLQQLSRSLAESLHDLGTIQNNLGNFVGEAEAVLQQQARINTDLQEGLMRTRMVSFSTQAARLRHIVRQTARELGKRVELNLENAEVELDRNVLERMIGPFEHMIRNSIDHGIEPEAERRRKGKPPHGRINIATSQEGSEVIIRFSDDGAGLNIKGIRAKAIERGLMPPDATLSEEELIQFILMAGFSTAETITHVSGRGVGMDVVHSEVKQLGGSMSVDTEAGVGTTFIIHLPLTLSITQALMVYVGDQLFAVPLGSVVNIVEFPIEKIASISMGKNPLLSHNEQVYPYMHLGQRLNIVSQPRNGKKVPVLLARTGTREVAIQVDGLGGTREVVIKSLGPQLSAIKGLAGATILGDGRVILILDIPGLWFRDDVIHFEHRPEGKVAQEVRTRPVVMVVDDSLTVRKVTSKHLQKRGMDVLVAKDGLDAVEQLRDHLPDVMLVDIEMPRMDGYELTTRVRSDETLRHIPIIMITSRAGAKHRQKAFELGVDMYMSKPYQEEELFNNIDALLAKGRLT
ncbi:chemotaxis protein CheA [Sulfuricaulis limicola]|uniref:Chemotaxis protein CheA n=1 Tax=Sulfuricaulis limicola TaxID=1620215 RepID=A0A1B4XIU4_9GAMM|nr:Hpt domain-containing protein [Sulfuricaulis limicola]BAV34717.1 chemotaxis protein CheA [Sulfuricaulis limicola]